jgi:nitrate reductase NapAB chaperone NapD
MAVVGALLRMHLSERGRIIRELQHLPGVSTFSVEEQERIGLVLEGPSLEELHSVLTTEIAAMPGVLGVWPAFAHCESEDEDRAERPATAQP